MSKRAIRLAKYLAEDLGWEIADHKIICKCGHIDYDKEHKFCSMCGAAIKRNLRSVRASAIHELEEALQFALHE